MARRKLLDDQSESLISPLIDVVMNGMAAMFIFLMVYLVVAQPKDTDPVRLQFLSVEPPPAIAGQPYAFTFPVAGGAGKERRFSLEGSLPAGLRFHEGSGTVFGNPESPGPAARRVELVLSVADERERAARKAALEVYPGAVPYDPDRLPLTIPFAGDELPTGRVGVPYEAVIGGLGGVEPYVWSVAGAMPPGLGLHDGRLAGTPAAAGAFELQVGLTQAPGSFVFRGTRYEWLGARREKRLRLRVLDRLTCALELPAGRMGEPYAGAVRTTGISPDERVRWQGEVPGLAPSADGLSLTGQPRKAGAFPVSFAIERAGQTLCKGEGTVRVREPLRPLRLDSPRELTVVAGRPLRLALAASGGEGAPVWRSEGELPPGLELSAAGLLAGKVDRAGVWQTAVSVRDPATGQEARQALAVRAFLTETEGPSWVTEEIPRGLEGLPYACTLAVAGGIGRPAFSFKGAPPPGLDFTAQGIAGVPARPGRWEIEAEAADAAGQKLPARRFVLVVEPSERTVPVVSTRALPPALAGSDYHADLAAEGGFGKYSWSLAGDLPPGLAFAGGSITGRVADGAAGEWRIDAEVRDETGRSARAEGLLLKVMAPPPPPPPPPTPVPAQAVTRQGPDLRPLAGVACLLVIALLTGFYYAGVRVGTRRAEAAAVLDHEPS